MAFLTSIAIMGVTRCLGFWLQPEIVSLEQDAGYSVWYTFDIENEEIPVIQLLVDNECRPNNGGSSFKVELGPDAVEISNVHKALKQE